MVAAEHEHLLWAQSAFHSTLTLDARLALDNPTYRWRQVKWPLSQSWSARVVSVSRPCTDAYVIAYGKRSQPTACSCVSVGPFSRATEVASTELTMYSTPFLMPWRSMGKHPSSLSPGQIHMG